jgi:hypothetical protein
MPSYRHHRVRVIALTGCDGAGKSTLAAGLVENLAQLGPTRLLYLGQSSGRIGEWISELPLVGPPLARYLKGKAAPVHDRKSTGPGSLTALVIYLLSRWRALKFNRMLALARRGVLVVADRYPQAEVAGFRFDGPHLARSPGGNWFVRRLAVSERKLYEQMAAYLPALVIRLNVDELTAHSRKPDHDLQSLREKIAVIPGLTFNGAHILDLDAREQAGTILEKSVREARAAIAVA